MIIMTIIVIIVLYMARIGVIISMAFSKMDETED